MITLLPEKKTFKISKQIYGQFAEHLGRCIYEGIYVGEDSAIPNVNGMRIDVVDALKELQIPVLRWPGGCFADEYHWKDGVGPKSERKTIVNTHWGGVTETNHFGTHEFFELVEQLGCQAYVNGNVGSGTVQEMQEWIEYMTMLGTSPMADLRRKNGREKPWKVDYFGVGNESWGCGGNMRPSFYADLYRQYQTYVRQYGDSAIYKIACGPNVDDYEWTDQVMSIASSYMNGLSLHHYSFVKDWHEKGSATEFPEDEWWSLLSHAGYMEELITKHTIIMDKYDPEKKVDLIVDEWGSWFKVENGTVPGFLYQQNTIRDAMVAAITLNIFHRHGDRVHMANIAQMVNVLQAMILTEGEQLVKTPTYHVFKLYRNHMEAEFVEGFGETPKNTTYTASRKNETLTISICNYNLVGKQNFYFDVGEYQKVQTAKILQGVTMNAHNTFENPQAVDIVNFENVALENEKLSFSLPPMSVATITLSR